MVPLLFPHTGEIEGRAAFYDLSLDGRWGGITTGDKIGCAGTVDAYVRGLS